MWRKIENGWPSIPNQTVVNGPEQQHLPNENSAFLEEFNNSSFFSFGEEPPPVFSFGESTGINFSFSVLLNPGNEECLKIVFEFFGILDFFLIFSTLCRKFWNLCSEFFDKTNEMVLLDVFTNSFFSKYLTETHLIKMLDHSINNPTICSLISEEVFRQVFLELGCYLLGKYEVFFLDDNYFEVSCSKGYVNMVKLLLRKRGDKLNSEILERSFLNCISGGHIHVLSLLLKDNRVNPFENEEIMKKACVKLNIGVLAFLFKDERVRKFLVNEDFEKYFINIFKEACLVGNVFVVDFFLGNDSCSKYIDPSQFDSQVLRFSCYQGNHEVVERLLKDDRVDPCAENHQSLRESSLQGHREVVRVLLKDERIKPQECHDCFVQLCQRGSTDIVKLFLDHDKFDPAYNFNQAFRACCYAGHLDIVEIMINDSRIDPGDCNNQPIRLAAAEGHLEVVKILLKSDRVDPSDCSNDAIIKAKKNGFRKVVEILMQNEKVKETIVIKQPVRSDLRRKRKIFRGERKKKDI